MRSLYVDDLRKIMGGKRPPPPPDPCAKDPNPCCLPTTLACDEEANGCSGC
jgi:hypothetical protein